MVMDDVDCMGATIDEGAGYGDNTMIRREEAVDYFEERGGIECNGWRCKWLFLPAIAELIGCVAGQ